MSARVVFRNELTRLSAWWKMCPGSVQGFGCVASEVADREEVTRSFPDPRLASGLLEVWWQPFQVCQGENQESRIGKLHVV